MPKDNGRPPDDPNYLLDIAVDRERRRQEAENAAQRREGQQFDQTLANNRVDRAKRADGLETPSPLERLQNAQLEPRLRNPATPQQQVPAQALSEAARQKIEAERGRTRQEDRAIVAVDRHTPEKPIGMLPPKETVAEKFLRQARERATAEPARTGPTLARSTQRKHENERE